MMPNGTLPKPGHAWRDRLRKAIERTHRKHSDIARGAGITPVTLSRLLNGEGSFTRLDTIVSIAREIGVPVGWLLGEPLSRNGNWDSAELKRAVQILLALIPEAPR